MDRLDPADFNVQHVYMTLDEVAAYDDVDAWLDTELGELLAVTDDEVRVYARKLRGEHLVDLVRDLPALVIVDTPEFTGLADGRGRYNLAVGFDLPRVPVILLTSKVSA
jgi:hypothetical protein